jgi:hypothetical protein
MGQEFKPAFGLRNRHFQTLYSSLFRKLPTLQIEIEKFELADGDFVDCYWHNKPKPNANTPIVILFHGLAGSFKSPYIQGIMLALANAGYASVLMHFRGCSGEQNRLPRSYHSGDSGDALAWIESLKKEYPHSKLFGVGYSLGGNMLLKLLGEMGNKSLLNAAVSVSPPMQLDICADDINRGFSKFYQYILMKDLKASLMQKYEKHDMQTLLNFKKENIPKLKTFRDFDGAYTAPIHGFSSAQDYYTRSSSRQFLKDIQTPTLIIHSSNDPFMSKKIIPSKNEYSKMVSLEISEYGGHVGFISGSFLRPTYYTQERIVAFFDAYCS